MIKTAILKKEDEHVKTYSHMDVENISRRVLKPSDKFKFVPDLLSKTKNPHMFWFNNGDVQLKNVNEIYCIDHINDNADLILPGSPKPNDWILLFYEQTTMILNVSHDSSSRIRINGNGERIMGYDEPLVCDIAFSSLRLTFIDKMNGWVLT